jgi:hypothetical protein
MTSAADFDFIFGSWIAHNHKLIDPVDPRCEEWLNFEARDEASPILGGIGHIHRMFAEDVPGGGSIRGLYASAARPDHFDVAHLVEFYPVAWSP